MIKQKEQRWEKVVEREEPLRGGYITLFIFNILTSLVGYFFTEPNMFIISLVTDIFFVLAIEWFAREKKVYYRRIQ